MKQFASGFLSDLEVELENHPKKEEIILEYADYLEQKYKDLLISGISMEQAEKLILQEMSDPKKIAFQFKRKGISVKATFQIVVILNYLLFVIGLLMTLEFYLFHGHGIDLLWNRLVDKKWFILFGYAAYWIMVGYLIGKKFGFNGAPLLRKTLGISLVPNYLLMMFVLFTEKLQGLFSPLITPSFTLMCITFTFLFYPISKISYKIGIIRGI